MKNTMLKKVTMMALILGVTAAHAENGGLMTELMAKKIPTQVISNPEAQIRLSQVNISNDTHQNGGLMAELMRNRFPVKITHSAAAQQHLATVTIPVGN